MIQDPLSLDYIILTNNNTYLNIILTLRFDEHYFDLF